MDSVESSYSTEGVPRLVGLLKGKLQSPGYEVVETDPQMILEVDVRAFDPGDRAKSSAATRLLGNTSDRRAALEDVAWALLNAKEFVLR